MNRSGFFHKGFQIMYRYLQKHAGHGTFLMVPDRKSYLHQDFHRVCCHAQNLLDMPLNLLSVQTGLDLQNLIQLRYHFLLCIFNQTCMPLMKKSHCRNKSHSLSFFFHALICFLVSSIVFVTCIVCSSFFSYIPLMS